jgi:CHRD domain
MKRLCVLAAGMLFLLVLPASAVAQRLPGSDPGGAPLTATLMAMPGMSGSGMASITVNPGQQEVCYQITTNGVTLPVIAAHIHLLATGDIVVPLFGQPTLPPPANSMATSFSGCVFTPRNTALAILTNPSSYFINVHTTDLVPIISGTLARG